MRQKKFVMYFFYKNIINVCFTYCHGQSVHGLSNTLSLTDSALSVFLVQDHLPYILLDHLLFGLPVRLLFFTIWFVCLTKFT